MGAESDIKSQIPNKIGTVKDMDEKAQVKSKKVIKMQKMKT